MRTCGPEVLLRRELPAFRRELGDAHVDTLHLLFAFAVALRACDKHELEQMVYRTLFHTAAPQRAQQQAQQQEQQQEQQSRSQAKGGGASGSCGVM